MSQASCVSKVGFLLLAILVLLAGCARGTGASVSGEVTLDGTPLEEGTISFIPKEGGQREAGWAMIERGIYEIPAASGLGVGAFRVEIRAIGTAGEKSDQVDPSLPVYAKESVPEKYNSKSQLMVDINAGENTADFELKSK